MPIATFGLSIFTVSWAPDVTVDEEKPVNPLSEYGDGSKQHVGWLAFCVYLLTCPGGQTCNGWHRVCETLVEVVPGGPA